ncbi:capsule biosynthesis GfcC family protein, partial [Vibrio anguillarum]
DIDWLSSALFDVSSPYQKKQQVLLAITHQESLAASAHKKRWRQLKEQLRARTFAQRIFTPLDPDITRITASQNPKLQGQWLLSLNALPTTVSVLGNVKQAGDMAWKPRTDAGHYVRSAGLAETDISQVWVIQPDGHASLHDIAYWNHDFQDIAPGATLYVPFPIETTSLYPQYSLHNVNDIVVELLRNQLP